MKYYQSRKELTEDVKFIKSIVLDTEYRNYLINVLFEQWMDTSPDSPWYVSPEEKMAAESLIKIDQSGVSSEWDGTHTKFNEEGSVSIKRNKHYNLRHL